MPKSSKPKAFPLKWQKCKPFVAALKRRCYLSENEDGLFMKNGVYLYMYELWQDGVEHGRGD